MAGWGSGGLLGESACVRACVCACVGLAPRTRTGRFANYSRHRNGNTRTSRVRRMDPAAGVASPGPEALVRPLSRAGRRVGAALLRTALSCTGVLDCAVSTVRRRLAGSETGGLLGCVVPTALSRTGRRVGFAGHEPSTVRGAWLLVVGAVSWRVGIAFKTRVLKDTDTSSMFKKKNCRGVQENWTPRRSNAFLGAKMYECILNTECSAYEEKEEPAQRQRRAVTTPPVLTLADAGTPGDVYMPVECVCPGKWRVTQMHPPIHARGTHHQRRCAWRYAETE